jgi:hypothetical protein
VCTAAVVSDINQLFNLPISVEAFQQLLVLAQDLADVSLKQEQDDVWTYSCGSTIYMPMKAYKMLIGTRQVHPCFSWLWKSIFTEEIQGLLLAALERYAKHNEHSSKKEKQGSTIL